MAALRGMHVSPAKHSYARLPKVWLPDRQRDGQRQTDGHRQTPDKVIPLCRYASQAKQQATQKFLKHLNAICILPLINIDIGEYPSSNSVVKAYYVFQYILH